MNQTVDILRRSFAGALAALVIASAMVQPVLERADVVHEPVVESQHAPGECPQSHDHTVCTQVGANSAAPAAPSVRGYFPPVHSIRPVTSHGLWTPIRERRDNPSRAPPLV
jgi:hypothetical protein